MKQTKTIFVISVDDERYISETAKNIFGNDGQFLETEMRPGLTYSILEAKRFDSQVEASAFLDSEKFKNAWRWNPVFSIIKDYFIKKIEIEFFETITKIVQLKDPVRRNNS